MAGSRIDVSAIESLHSRGRVAHPAFAVEFDVFRPHANRALAHLGETQEPSAIHAEDLYLACACSLGQSQALSEFDSRYATLLNRMGKQAESAGIDRADFMQQLHMHLFVKSSATASPAIASYVGSGPLGAWVRVVGARIALGLIRQNGTAREANDPPRDWAEATLSTGGVDVAAMRLELRDTFQQALDSAAGAICVGDRAVLRQYYFHKIGVDGVAKLLGVHRSNASRAIARARGNFMREVRQRLGELTGLTPSSVNSVLAFMRSDLAIHLDAVFRS